MSLRVHGADRFNPHTGAFATGETVQALYLREPREGDALVSSARGWQGRRQVTEMVADLAMAALLDLLGDLPEDATVADVRRELRARASDGVLRDGD